MKVRSPGQSTPPDAGDRAAKLRSSPITCKIRIKEVLWESLLVAVIGSAFAFAANAISPRGLRLAKDYFPGAIPSSLPEATTTPLTPSPGNTNVAVPAPANLLAARLQAKGLQLIESHRVTELFRDPRFEQELIVFIDARDDQHYQEGHIPGAHQFNHYRAEKYFATVIPVCQTAQQIVVYCTGGDCEDSEFAAIFLRDAGIPQEKLFVYGGGMTEWTTNGLPVEMGARKSGNFRRAKP